MLFTNISFLYYFLPVLIIIYFIMPKKFKNIILFLWRTKIYFINDIRNLNCIYRWNFNKKI